MERTRNERDPWLVAGVESDWVFRLRVDYNAALDVLEGRIHGDWRY